MERIIYNIVTGYIVIMSFVGFLAMFIDKKRAIKGRWRLPEKTLFFIAFTGGGIGSFLGMYLFHHKTRHVKFVILIPVAAVIYLCVILIATGLIRIF